MGTCVLSLKFVPHKVFMILIVTVKMLTDGHPQYITRRPSRLCQSGQNLHLLNKYNLSGLQQHVVQTV